MVFFTCNSCGSSLKKQKVDQHLQRCRHAEYLTCIDCSKDFGVFEYQSHVRCITEDEKYGAAGTQSKQTKGDIKQKNLMEKIDAIISEKHDMPRQLLLILQQLQSHTSVPYKKGKFMNFLKNALNVRNPKLIEETWNLVFNKSSTSNADDSTTAHPSASTEIEMRDISSQNVNSSQDDQTPAENLKENIEHNEPESNGQSNSQFDDQDEDDSNITKSSNRPFPWKNVIKACLRSSKENQLPVKRLRKKVWSEYVIYQSSKSEGKPQMSEGEFKSAFMKRIKKNRKLRLNKDRVSLVA